MSVMKKTFLFVCVIFTAGSVLAQVNYYRAKQQAVRDSQQNDAEQQRIARESNGGAAPAAAAAPAPATAAPVDPALQATLNNINSLQSDFSAAANATANKPDPAQKVALMNNLSHAAQGEKKASADSVKKLADDLLTAMAGKKKLAAVQQTKLAREVHALFNSAHLSPAQQQLLLTDVQKILTDGGASLDEAVNVVTDLKAVVAETK
jgi:hypothetical protein